MATNLVTNFKTTLSSGLASGGSETTIDLSSVTTTDGHVLVMTDIGDIGFIVINPGGSTMEICSFTGFSSTQLTGVIRGLPFWGTSLAAVTANKKAHGSGETVIISNNHHWMTEQYVNVDDAQTISGVKTFSATPINTGGNPTADTELATKAYVDLGSTGTATINKMVIAGTAGETLTIGQVVYLKSSDSRWWLADADSAGTSENVLLGIAQGAGTAGNAITSGVLLSGLDTNQTGLTANTVYYVSNTAGGLSSTAGTKEVTAGVATSTTSIHFFPRYNQQLTENQQDLVEQIEAGTDWYAASAVGTDSYAITIAPAITAYATGMRFRFKTDVANTGACTLAVSGLTAKTIKRPNGNDTETGDIAAGQVVEVVYDGTNLQMVSGNSQTTALAKFGGDGADGALNVTSGTTTITLGSASYVEKNYTSINVSAGATLAFSGPATTGTVVILRSQGAVTIAGTVTANNFGGAGGAEAAAAGNNGSDFADILDASNHFGALGAQNSAGTGGAGGTAGAVLDTTSVTNRAIPYTTATTYLYRRNLLIVPGSGGGSGAANGGSAGNRGGAGGVGGGGLLIEAGGAWNFTGTINMNGTAGSNATSAASDPGGTASGGGGGGAGQFVALYNTLTASSGTVTIAGGAGGTGGSATAGTDGGCGGGAGGAGVTAAGGAGGAGGNANANGTAGTAGTGASGGAGGSAGTSDGSSSGGGGGGGGGGTGSSLIAKNLWFA